MGNSVSVIEYKELLNQMLTSESGDVDRDTLTKFLSYSEDSSDQAMVFTSTSPEDIKSVKQSKPKNLSKFIIQVIDVFYKMASESAKIDDPQHISVMKGAVNVLIKFLPYIMDSKAFMDKILWDGEGVPTGVKLCQGILIMLFKPGYSVRVLSSDVADINTKGIDQNILWKNGVSTSGEVYNHSYTNFDTNRIGLLRLLLI